ncbi:hypothetical protein BJ684DRAFT_17000 [Piptocephalis cylindrospora]|uniref:Uncharacterized protein n=1 Tax=Piptocephalis cylindrospora TaxID=1907219 RepID=A0A4P9Y115_9FUNG|nr:hypothetical protein BJ684DRAFT_17000 [Piptocephalis cylindrospora]|eukprot:RKP12516.1 hypothetical protein BJ684DRAFT_17000 [Piptocephalis cylindrospora]
MRYFTLAIVAVALAGTCRNGGVAVAQPTHSPDGGGGPSHSSNLALKEMHAWKQGVDGGAPALPPLKELPWSIRYDGYTQIGKWSLCNVHWKAIQAARITAAPMPGLLKDKTRLEKHLQAARAGLKDTPQRSYLDKAMRKHKSVEERRARALIKGAERLLGEVESSINELERKTVQEMARVARYWSSSGDGNRPPINHGSKQA